MDQFEIHFRKKYYEFYSGSSLAFEVRQGLVFLISRNWNDMILEKNMYRMHQGTLSLVKVTPF